MLREVFERSFVGGLGCVLFLFSLLFVASCANTNEKGLFEVNFKGKANSPQVQRRVLAATREKLAGRASLLADSVVDKRLYKNRIGAFVENTDYCEWLNVTLQSWLLNEPTERQVNCMIEVQKAYLDGASTSFKAVFVAKITAQDVISGKVLLSRVYRGNEVNLNYWGADSEYAICMCSSVEEAWLAFLEDLSGAI